MVQHMSIKIDCGLATAVTYWKDWRKGQSFSCKENMKEMKNHQWVDVPIWMSDQYYYNKLNINMPKKIKIR